MYGGIVPDDNYTATQMPKNATQEVCDARAIERLSVLRLKEEGHALTSRRYAQSAYDTYIAAIRPLVFKDGGFSARCQGAADEWCGKESAFINQYDVSIFSVGFF